MKLTAAILVLAAAVMAAPYDNPPPNPSHTPAPDAGAGAGKCGNNQKTVCCDKVLGLVCTLGLVNNCGSGKSYCCNADAPITQNGGLHILDLNIGSCNRIF